MRKQKIKQKLFDKGVEALQKITGKKLELYLCPICANGFNRHDLDTGTLTLEHVPPKSLRGKTTVLTCKKCNSTAGHSIDAAIVNRERLFSSIEALVQKSGSFEGRADLEIGGKTANVNLQVDNGSVTIKPVKERNPPETLKSLKDYMIKLAQEGRWDGEEFKLTPRVSFHQWLSKVGDLRTAYLICFAFFGYRYILNSRVMNVRRQIIEYNEPIIDRFWVSSDESLEDKYGLYLLAKPISSIAVKISKFTMILPWLDGPDDIYRYLSERYPGEAKISFSGERLRWPQSLELNLDFYEPST